MIARYAFWVVAAIAVLYAPLAINYMWHFFDPGVVHLQREADTALNGAAYENGPLSVNVTRHDAYADHRVAMLVHTTLGGIALLLALFQFSPRLRTRHRTLHKWTGRVYLPLMTISMLTAIAFLVMAPIVHFDGGRAFDLQLWALASGTLASGWIGFAAIRRKDMVTHRAWMTMNLSLMMTAPLLRVGWFGLGRIIDNPLLLNLSWSSVALGVIAPGGAGVAFVLTARIRRRDGAVPRPGPIGRYAALVGAGLIGALALLLLDAGLINGVQDHVSWLHVIPLVGYVAVCLTGALRRRAAGDALREQAWGRLLAGAVAAPYAALLVTLVLTPAIGFTEAYITGLMVGVTGPIVASFALVVYQSGRWPVLQRG